ncbi:Six-hairpin glycosidase-like protein [Pseudomassariella vexata]|uniref:Six-hairpin glycosidase-like protein n=1 Tax=Pseudomassariella vexata TaxID=1141098 RepID=A0A1Y2DX83_9PEZI|nr:Six-hairpin glycosidase-like protein [Pseudomassariella vexata]ORY63873.1 Six-hairpin glycosidase-like protein [Pseudomassariella vexata]
MTLSAGLWTLAALVALPNVLGAGLDTCALASQHFGNDAPWYIARIPFFESSDAAITEVYYYRWKIFRAHQRDLGTDGYISTEFIDDVSWQIYPSASLVDASGFHLLEGRWNRDRRFKEDYATFMYSDESNPRRFTETLATSIWQGYLVDGVVEDVLQYLDSMQTVYNAWDTDSYDTSKGLYWIEPLLDATEYTIASIDASCGEDGFLQGYAFRPSINSYQYANARAIANLATLKGGLDSVVEDYTSRAETLKSLVQIWLWNSTLEHFIDRHESNTACVSYWEPIRGRELVGYVPWTHDLPDDNATFAQSWKHLVDTSELLGEHGMRTNEPSYEYYMRQYRYAEEDGAQQPECQWNGPVWPFQTTQVLTALGNLLDHYPESASTEVVSRVDYTSLLKLYANLHYNPTRNNALNLEEDYYPDTGAPIVGLDRSSHYFHSGYIDLVLSGLVGIRPRSDDVLEVNPLVSTDVAYFRAENVLYHGNDVAIQWDVDGSHYGVQGLQIELNGVVAASSPSLARLTVDAPRKYPPEFPKPVAKSIQLQDLNQYPEGPAYPLGSVSLADQDSAKVQDAIDGRVFFFPETDYTIAHGWQTPVGDGSELWYMVDFGAQTETRSAEIAFFENADQGVDGPVDYRVQVDVDGNGAWEDAAGAFYGDVVGNGITYAEWGAVSVRRIRLVFTPKEGLKVRLVEWKVFDEVISSSDLTERCSSLGK